MILGRVTAVVTRIILGKVGGDRRRRRRRSRNTPHATCGKPTSSPGARGVFAMAMATAVIPGRTRMRIFVLGRRSSVFDIFGVEGEVGGVGQETFSIAPAHIRRHGDGHEDQNS